MFNSNLKKGARVENISDIKEHVVIEYPSKWTYKLISEHHDHTKEAIKDVIAEKEHNLTISNTSKGGKYVSMNLELLVMSEEERTFIFEALKAHVKIKMVL